MTVLEVIQKGADHLAKKGVEAARLQVELMLAHLLKMPRLNLYLNFGRCLQEPEVECLRDWIKRRGQHEPLQYVLGSVSFCGVELEVNRSVLIPRPETEVLAELAWTWLLNDRTSSSPELHVLDYGTGSGCLAIVLALRCPEAKLWAVDKSSEALQVASANARTHQVDRRIQLFQAESLEAVPDQRFHLIVTNPPYIPTDEITRLQPEVRDHEPRLALDGGPDGLAILRALAVNAAARLAPGGQFMSEFGDGQETILAEWFAQPPWQRMEIRPDNSGRPRILIAEAGRFT
jgi:release factor glutamine methyltransferase